MLGRSVVLAVLVVLSCAGCAPALSVGAPCALNSDCDPLACLAGRCRNECRTSRDCPIGLACVDVAGGVTACQVPQDDSCGAGCAGTLECVLGRCVQPCIDELDCVAENVCTAGACAPAPTTMMGSCSPLSPASGCGDAEVCFLSGDTFACAPAPASPVPLGGPCTSASACGAGQSCASGRCVRLCVPETSSCGAGLLCRTDVDLLGVAEGVSSGPRPPPGLGYCTERCDPLASGPGGCPVGTECSIGVTAGRQGFFYYCRSLLTPALMPNDDCAEPIRGDRCPEGTICAPSMTERLCLTFCDPTAPMPCVAGTCIPIAGTEAGECQLTP